MNAPLAARPAWTIAHRIWRDGRWGFCALVAMAVLWAVAVHITVAVFQNHVVLQIATMVATTFALLLTFLLCHFTETDRQERRSGYPARLFVLPIHTRTLIGAPVVFGVVMAWIIYLAWAKLALFPIVRELPLGLSLTYLATGMICYHALLWSLAGYRVLRLIALSSGGGIFTVGWLVISDHRWLAPFLGGIAPRLFLGGLLTLLSLSALAVAYLAVETQRHGGLGVSRFWARLSELVVDALPRNQRCFASPARAQFWLEWRRHGVLLPLCTAGVVLLVMAVSPFIAPISASVTLLMFESLLITPIVLGFALGQGLGKADLWSSEAGLPLFLATRPLPHTKWIGAKMKAAALATVISWSLMAVLVPLWLWQWCDARLLLNLRDSFQRAYSPAVFYALPVLILGVLMILTWRSLIASLFIGLSGRTWLLTAATCSVVFVVTAIPGAIVILIEHPKLIRRLLAWPSWTPWTPWLLTALVIAKLTAATLLATHARRRGWLDGRAIARYLAVWFSATAFLLLAAQWLLPLIGWKRWLSIVLILFLVPLLRVAYAPIALAQNRHR